MPIVFRFASVAGVAEKGPLALYSTRAASRSRNHWQHVLFIWTRDTARCTERETPDSHLNTADIFPLVLFFLNTELQTHLCHIVHSWSKLMSIWWSGAERDLSLATPLATLLKTAVFVPFSWQERRGTGVFFCIHIKRETFQMRTSALPQRQAWVKWAWKRYTSQMSFSRTMRCC